MASKNLKPRMEQDLPDSALQITDMLKGKVMKFKNDWMSSTTNTEKRTEFDGFFKALDERAELAKQAVILDGLESFMREMDSTPESRIVEVIDGILSKMDVAKTNLPSVPEREDDVATLDENVKEDDSG